MRNLKHKIFVLLCLLGLGTLMQAAPDPNFHIYICWGQSNMEGNATVPNEEKTGVSERFQMLYTANDCSNGDRKLGQWYTATPPLARCFHWNNGGFGPIDYFGRTLVEKLDPSIKVGVIVVACGGASIQLFEPSNYKNYLATCADWLRGYADSYGGNPYQRIIDMAKIAQEVGVIKGILVHQGESDNGQSDWPKRLNGVYENMLNDLKLKASEVPLLVGEVRHTGPCSGHNNTIKRVPSVIPTAHIISAEGCEAAGDDFHFSVAGYKLLGKRYAEKMLELLGDNPVAQQDLLLSLSVTKESEPGVVEIDVKKENNDIRKVEIYADDKIIATDQASFVWENIREGKHTVWAVGYDSNNKQYTTSKTTITIMEEQKPFNGFPAKIPGKIEAEEFDYGGEGNAYHDNDEENRNGGSRNEGVDLNDIAIGYSQTGEWIEYTVEVEEDGEYSVESRVASGSNTAAFTLYMDNQFIIPGDDGTPGGFIDVPNTGDWSTFTTIETKLNKLTKGVHVLKIEITGDWVDLDYLKFNLIKADKTKVTDLKPSKENIPDGRYYAYDANGKLIKVITLKNAYSDELGKGLYILKDFEGKAYPMVVK
ncbi:MAG: carbohydrate-binding protein [Paludibacteraceae bacterium]|nr:carbohydrate-binding protein [Paludibacteraceae bacterium]